MQDYAIFRMGLDQEFVGGEIGSIGQFATAEFPTADVEVALAEADCSSALAPPSIRKRTLRRLAIQSAMGHV
jgi:hypothetical protein